MAGFGREKGMGRLFSDVSRKLVQSLRSDYALIYQDRIMSLRHYAPIEDDSIDVAGETINVSRQRVALPLLLVPPLAATSIIFDLMPHRSVVRYFLAQGFDVYLVDWGEVTADHTDISLETYVLEWMPAVVREVQAATSAHEISVFSYCMGGLLTLMYLATAEDAPIRNLVTVASPVDMHSSGAAGKVLARLNGPAQVLSSALNLSLLDLPGSYFHVPGWFSSLAFKMTNPVGSLINAFDLIINLWDRDYLKERLTMSKWFDDMVDYPGATVREMAVHMLLNNSMASGKVRVGRVRARCDRIRCNLLAFAGRDDNLVTVPAAQKLLDIVASEDKTFCLVPGGHAGVFAGSQAPAHTWRIAGEWLRERSVVQTKNR
jgi:polyhydroxyalkanoate synthase